MHVCPLSYNGYSLTLTAFVSVMYVPFALRLMLLGAVGFCAVAQFVLFKIKKRDGVCKPLKQQ